MSRGTHTKTSQSGGSPKDFVHLNKFSTLAPDDNEFTCEICTSMHTSRDHSQQRDENEMMDAQQPLRQKFQVTNEDPVHRNEALIKYRTLRRQAETAREFIM